MLYLSSWNIDRRRASERSKKNGDLVNIARGVYISQGDDAERAIRESWPRVAQHFYPKARLMGPSVATKAPIDSKGFLASSHAASKDVGQTTLIALRNTHMDRWVETQMRRDEYGKYNVIASSPGAAYAETAVLMERGWLEDGDELLAEMLARAVERAGTGRNSQTLVKKSVLETTQIYGHRHLFETLMDRIWTKLYSTERPQEKGAGNNASENVKSHAATFDVHWFGRHVAKMDISRNSNRLTYQKGWLLPLSLAEKESPNSLPAFIDNLLPDRYRDRMDVEDDLQRIGAHGRLLNNIDIVRAGTTPTPYTDRLDAHLADYTGEELHWFGGRHDLGHISSATPLETAHEITEGAYPRLSGVQVKAPCFLSSDGVISVAQDRPFTHILKLPGTGKYEAMGALEWAGMSMAEAAGLNVPAFGLLPLEEAGLCFVTERFDIPGPGPSGRQMMQEDMLSLMGEPAISETKYDAAIEQVGKLIGRVSSATTQDMETLFQMALVSWLAGNSDMHLKNISLLKQANPCLTEWEQIRVAPVYDFVCATGLPAVATSQALSVAGRKQDLDVPDFMDLAANLNLGDGRALDIMLQSTAGISAWSESIGHKVAEHIESNISKNIGKATAIAIDHAQQQCAHVQSAIRDAYLTSMQATQNAVPSPDPRQP